eukprot:COSAG02_NODE_5620_length_4177_cov_30.717018_6_plen_55_part_01
MDWRGRRVGLWATLAWCGAMDTRPPTKRQKSKYRVWGEGPGRQKTKSYRVWGEGP